MPESESDLLPNKRGINDRAIRREEFLQLLADFLDTQLYRSSEVSQHELRFKPERKYTVNREFWRDALANQHYDGQRIRLKDFTLMEWIPPSPGRFYTDEATQKRILADEYYEGGLGQMEYLPLGKLEMILGGVGSLRLGSRPYGNKTIHVLGLSSTGVSHEGIPAALDDNVHSSLIKELRTSGGVLVDAMMQ